MESSADVTSQADETKQVPEFRRIWIGGTSGLARTYYNAFQSAKTPGRDQYEPSNEPWLLLGHQSKAPAWISHFDSLYYRQVDFLNPDLDAWRKVLECKSIGDLSQVVISIRPPLVAHHSFNRAAEMHKRMIDGFRMFLEILLDVMKIDEKEKDLPWLKVHIVHASSIAAIDHVQEQRLRSEASLPDPPSSSLFHPYDRFKRRCEEVLDELVPQYKQLHVTHVRLGAFFSDDPYCIQCSALALQAHVGFDLPTRIDCNSARNVAVLLRAILDKEVPAQAIRYFYYTRPLSFSTPVPYSAYLVAYRRAHHILIDLWLPLVLLDWIIRFVSSLAEFWPSFPFVQSLDYLLQVTRREHSFDLSLVGAAYPTVVAQEETIFKCFDRRSYYLREDF